jgi:hypothetical protein
MQLYLSCYLAPLRPMSLPQHPILKHTQPMFFPLMQGTKTHIHTEHEFTAEPHQPRWLTT